MACHCVPGGHDDDHVDEELAVVELSFHDPGVG